MLIHILVSWLVSAFALWLMAQMVSGIELRGFGDAMIATVVIAVVNAVIGPVVRFFSFPFIILTLGLFLVIVNAMLLKLASMLTPGFKIRGFFAAIIGSVVLTVLTWFLRLLVF